MNIMLTEISLVSIFIQHKRKFNTLFFTNMINNKINLSQVGHFYSYHFKQLPPELQMWSFENLSRRFFVNVMAIGAINIIFNHPPVRP